LRRLSGPVGAYATSPPDARELDGLLATADAALYRMKSGSFARIPARNLTER